MGDTYTCEECGGTFDKEWTDEEANAEAQKLFGTENASAMPSMAQVCDDCFKDIMGREREILAGVVEDYIMGRLAQDVFDRMRPQIEERMRQLLEEETKPPASH